MTIKLLSVIMNKCEGCFKEFKEIYGSGRFCSEICARSFSTKNKRILINDKVSKKLGKYKHTILKDDIEKAISASFTMAEASKKLKLPFTSFKRLAIKYELYAPNQGWAKGLKLNQKYDDKTIFSENSIVSQKVLKKRYLELIDYKCNKCNISKWMSKKILLELDHINGIKNDNRLENLRLLCPNCHSQTPTYKGRNIKKSVYKKISDDQLLSALKNANNIKMALETVNLTPYGGNYTRAKRILLDNNLTFDHS